MVTDDSSEGEAQRVKREQAKRPAVAPPPVSGPRKKIPKRFHDDIETISAPLPRRAAAKSAAAALRAGDGNSAAGKPKRSIEELAGEDPIVVYPSSKPLFASDSLPPFTTPGRLPSNSHVGQSERPPYSISHLIAQAIANTSESTRRAIAHWIAAAYPYYQTKALWRELPGLVRYTLLTSNCFIKTVRYATDQPTTWQLRPEYALRFDGNTIRKSRRERFAIRLTNAPTAPPISRQGVALVLSAKEFNAIATRLPEIVKLEPSRALAILQAWHRKNQLNGA